MQIREVAQCEPFTVTDLWERHSTDGFVKVVHTVTTLVEFLPEDVFTQQAPPSPPSLLSAHPSTDSITLDPSLAGQPVSAREAARNNIIRELVETERKYVQDLEVMQKYSTALSQSNTIDQDTIHLLFPNLNKLLNFQRKFLIRLEGTGEQQWKDQRWGLHFTEMEDDFIVYEPYCANYTNASEIMLAEEQNLMSHSHLINAKSELPAFLIKPIQRICKYPLLLESLLKASSPEDYPYYEELKQGCASAKRITDKINEAQRRAENLQTVRNLESRIEDWKGHHISNFGELLLEDVFVVTKSDVDREYHVFLFQRIILCCKEMAQQPPNPRKVSLVSKNNSILKKQAPSPMLNMPGGSKGKKSTPLLLKGRIFLNNVTQAVPTVASGQYSLAVWWRGDDDLEFFTLRCRNEEQLKQWEIQINKLINENARRASERFSSRLPQLNNGTSPHPHGRGEVATLPPMVAGSAIQHLHLRNARQYHEDVGYASSSNSVYSNGSVVGPQRYPPHHGFDTEAEDDFEEYPPANGHTESGRGTPSRIRRMYADASDIQPYPFRTSGFGSGSDGPPIASGVPARLTMGRGLNGHNTDGYPSHPVPSTRPTLRSQFSSTKLRLDTLEGGSKPLTLSNDPMISPTTYRARSHSQPASFVQKSAPPPVPVAPWLDRSSTTTSTTESKRGSGSSQSSSDFSGHGSPITPYGSSESSLLRNSRSHSFDHMNGSSVKVKVHFHEDIFIIQVPRETEYSDLVEKVGRKIRLCGPRREDGPLRVKYRDEDGDLVSLGSTEDVQMAFELLRPGGQVTLYVT